MNSIKLILLIAISLMYGCARIEIIDTGMTSNQVLAQTEAKDIFIYRSQKPDWNYKEIGLVSVNGIKDIKLIYSMIREESSAKGAHGVIDFDLDSEEVTSSSTVTRCLPEGGCSTTTTMITTVIYTASGTLIIKDGV